MITSIDIDNKEENVYTFKDFELVIHEEISYILCDSGYFTIEGLESFKKADENQYIIFNDDNDKFLISEEDFEKVKAIYLKGV